MNIRNQSCPNEKCSYFDQICAGNVVIHSRKESRFRCNCCGKTWVGHRDSVHYGLRSGERKIMVTGYMLGEGFSIRHIAKMIGVSPSTVQRFKKRINNYSLI